MGDKNAELGKIKLKLILSLPISKDRTSRESEPKVKFGGRLKKKKRPDMTINYAQMNKVRPVTPELTQIQTVRLISTIKEGFEVYLVVVFYESGKVDTRSFFSQQAAFKKINELAPKLAKFVKVETV